MTSNRCKLHLQLQQIQNHPESQRRQKTRFLLTKWSLEIWNNRNFPDYKILSWRSGLLRAGKTTPTSVRSAKNTCPLRRSSPCISGRTTRLNHRLIPMTQLAKPRCTTAVYAARCSLRSALLTDTCLFTLESVRSRVCCADKRSPPTAICTGTRELTEQGTRTWFWMRMTPQQQQQLVLQLRAEGVAEKEVCQEDQEEVERFQNKRG